MRGIALRFGTDDIDVGTLGSLSSFGLTFYSSKPKENKDLQITN